MASKIRYYLEQSVPELDDLKKKGLFDQKEITMIMRRRTDFEHRIQGRGSHSRDFLKYSEFEINLEKLRAIRYSRLQKAGKLDTKPSISDWAGFRRIVFVFDRAVRRYPGDVELWDKYISFVKSKDAVKVVYRVYAKLLLLQPRNIEAWLSAAKYEFEENANAKSARELFQRALKLNPELQKLWLTYIQFELTYVSKLLIRRKALGLLTEQQQSDDLKAQNEEAEERKNKSLVNGIEENDEIIAFEDEEEEDPEVIKSRLALLPEADMNVLGNPDTNPVLKGDIALAIFDMCIPQILKHEVATKKEAKVYDTAVKFLNIIQRFLNLNRDYLYLHVLRYLQANCGDQARNALIDVSLSIRTVGLNDAELPESLQLAVNKFNAYKKKLQSEDKQRLAKEFVAYLEYKLTSPLVSLNDEQTVALVKAIIEKCR